MTVNSGMTLVVPVNNYNISLKFRNFAFFGGFFCFSIFCLFYLPSFLLLVPLGNLKSNRYD